MAVEDIVTEDEGCGSAGDEVFCYMEGLRKSFWAWLDGVLQINAVRTAIP